MDRPSFSAIVAELESFSGFVGGVRSHALVGAPLLGNHRASSRINIPLETEERAHGLTASGHPENEYLCLKARLRPLFNNQMQCMLCFENVIWCGTNTGVVLAVSQSTLQLLMKEAAHKAFIIGILPMQGAVCTICHDGTLVIWDTTTFKLIKRKKTNRSVLSVAVVKNSEGQTVWIGIVANT